MACPLARVSHGIIAQTKSAAARPASSLNE
jgi:hypothetical protein